ncbi:hypothetical protein AB0O28_18585 [Microbispora sp. NPDC088329]|uniref:hypothetical protein n=1 Tax=Microbispora sp. NPDC088329 TaxID=3154869 RepID=UPI00341EFD6F
MSRLRWVLLLGIVIPGDRAVLWARGVDRGAPALGPSPRALAARPQELRGPPDGPDRP